MTSVIERYRALVKAGELRPDPEQAIAAERLHRLAGELEAVPKKGSILWRALGRLPEPPRGLYVWGSVGRGKSMLMDLFYESVNIRRKRRVHFHEFMLEVH
jgi:cell division protein ZapE